MQCGTTSAIFNSSGKVFVDMQLFMQFAVGTNILFLVILIMFVDISLVELFLQSLWLTYFKNFR